MTDYTIIRSYRQSIGLQIRKDASLIIRAPFFVSRKTIEKVVYERQTWIERTKKRILEQNQNGSVQDLFSDGKIPYLGLDYPLEEKREPCVPLRFSGSAFEISKEYRPHAKTMFERFCKKQAREFLPGRVNHFILKSGLAYQTIRINSARTRWGSCSTQGSLNFSWRVMMAPPAVIDYVVAHEVAHLKHPNHSRRFWEFVSELCGDWRSGKEWLRKHGDRLMLSHS